jgi:hypothetical protein
MGKFTKYDEKNNLCLVYFSSLRFRTCDAHIKSGRRGHMSIPRFHALKRLNLYLSTVQCLSC